MTQVSNICTKANGTLNFLRQNLYPCLPSRREGSLQSPVVLLGCCSSVGIRKCATCDARFVTGNYNYETGSNMDN